MNTDELNIVIQNILKEMEVNGYKQETIKSEKYVFNSLLKFCKDNNIKKYDFNVGLDFLEKHYNLSNRSSSNRYKCRRLRSIYLIEWFQTGENITRKSIPQKKKFILPKNYTEIIAEYTSFLKNSNSSNKTIKSKVITLTKLFEFASSRKINFYKAISKQLIYDFVEEQKQKYEYAYIYSILYHIKTFYDYLYGEGKSKINGKTLFPRIIKKERLKLLSYYTKEEIKQILSFVDTSTDMGKRDYAVLLLAITYGLRNSDIVNLKFDNIDWMQNKIKLIQYKTQEKLELELIEEVKFALLDYIKNARPNFISDYIFLKFKMPYEYSGNKSLYMSTRKYIEKSNISINNRKKGLHSFRHSCATNLLANNVKLPVITGILGHSSMDITNIYLSVDLEQLKKISLEVPKYE